MSNQHLKWTSVISWGWAANAVCLRSWNEFLNRYSLCVNDVDRGWRPWMIPCPSDLPLSVRHAVKKLWQDWCPRQTLRTQQRGGTLTIDSWIDRRCLRMHVRFIKHLIRARSSPRPGQSERYGVWNEPSPCRWEGRIRIIVKVYTS